jgi:hypothetical protein
VALVEGGAFDGCAGNTMAMRPIGAIAELGCVRKTFDRAFSATYSFIEAALGAVWTARAPFNVEWRMAFRRGVEIAPRMTWNFNLA